MYGVQYATIDPVRRPGQRAGLTHAEVIAAARGLLDTGDLDSLTMRALAAKLQVSPNALYSHVTSKTALVDDLLDDVLAEVAVPDPQAGPPRAGLHSLMGATYAVLLRYADLVPIYLARQGARGPNAQRLGEVMTTLLARADVTGADAREALRVLVVYTIGFAAFVTGGALGRDEELPERADELHDNFDSGLDWLLSGILAPSLPDTSHPPHATGSRS